jgi:hypothetical protein
MDPVPLLGVRLRLTTTEEGGRDRELGPFGDRTLQYRPNWGFRGLDHPREQAGAPVLCWARDRVGLGETVRAVIAPMFPEAWVDVGQRSELVMYEGARAWGQATVIWRRQPDRWPLDDSDLQPLRAWAQTGEW